MLAGIVLGGWHMARSLLAARVGTAFDAPFLEARGLTARFYLAHILPRAAGHAGAAMASPELVMAMAEEQF